jgi:hypothetical protein
MKPRALLPAVLLLAILPACARTGPVTSPQDLSTWAQGQEISPRFLLGFWDIGISPDLEIEVTPDRGAAMHLNAVGFLEKSPCSDCFRILNPHVFPDNVVRVDLEVIHPFPGNVNLM